MIARTSETTPVEVSDCWQKHELDARLADRGADLVGIRDARPTRSGAPDTSSPCCSQIAIQRSPNEPWLTTATRSPGAQRFATADSIAPVPEAVKRSTSALVRKTSFSRSSVLLVDVAEIGAAVVDDRLRAAPRAPRAARASARA